MKTLSVMTMTIRNGLRLAGMLSTMVAQSWIVNVPSLPYSHGAGTTCGKGNNLTSSNAPLCGIASYYDSEDMVWVFTPTTSGQVTITLTHPYYGAWTGLMLYEGGSLSGSGLTGSTCIAYLQNSSTSKTLIANVSAGQTYYLHLDAWGPPDCGPFTELTISAPTPPLPAIINVPSLPYNSGSGTTCGAGDKFNSSTLSPLCGNSNYYNSEDMMWIFTPTATGQVTIQLTSSTPWTGLVVYQGGTFDPTTNTLTGGSCVATHQSADANKTFRLCVQAGQTYYLILDQWGPPYCGAFTNLSISAPDPNPPTPYFVQIPSLPYAHGAGTTCGMGNNFDVGSLPANMICGSSYYYNSEDMLFSFTPAGSGPITIELTSNTTYTGLVLYEGGTFDPTCGTYTGGTCVIAEQSPSSNKTISTSVTAGQTYYLLLDQWGPPSCGPFTNLTISAPPTPTPQIINVTTLPYSSGPGSTCTSQNWFSHTNTPVCGDPAYYGGKDILWRFQPTASGVVTIQYTGSSGNNALMVYRGGVPNTSTGGLIGSTCIAYRQDTSSTKSLDVCVQAGDTYYVHVDRAPFPDCESFGNLTISAPATVTPPMTIINTLPYNHGAGTTCGSGDNIDERRVPVCGNPIYYSAGATGEDRMWRFTPAQSGYVRIQLQGNPSSGTSFTVYEGGSFSPCGRLLNTTCKAVDQGSTADLRHTICVQAGTPYFIILDTLSGGCVSFNGLSLSAPVAPPNPSIGVVAVNNLPYRHVADSTCRKGDKVNSFNVPNSCVAGPSGTLPDGAEDMIWVFSPTVDQTVRIVLSGTNSSSRLVLYKGGLPNPCPPLGTFTCEAMDNDTLEVSLQAGEIYYLLAESVSPGCLRFDSLTISRIGTTSITEELFPLTLEIYPNPTSDVLHLRGYHLTTEPILLTLWNVTGGKVQEYTFYPQASRWEMTLSLHHLPSGLYVLQAMQGERQKQFRIQRLP